MQIDEEKISNYLTYAHFVGGYCGARELKGIEEDLISLQKTLKIEGHEWMVYFLILIGKSVFDSYADGNLSVDCFLKIKKYARKTSKQSLPEYEKLENGLINYFKELKEEQDEFRRG